MHRRYKHYKHKKRLLREGDYMKMYGVPKKYFEDLKFYEDFDHFK